jgi:superfamily II DNA or RNA helicase
VSLWPNQVRFVEGGLAAIQRRRAARIVLSSPTGTGKSRAMCVLIERLVAAGYYVVLYSNRNLLIEQLQITLTAAGIDFGVRARGYDDDEDFWPVQISSLPTETSRVLKRRTWQIHGKGRAGVALVDEAHLNQGDKVREILALHLAEGHAVVGVTATPIGLAEMYDELIVCGTLAEGREVGALALAEMYAPDEPDFRLFKKLMKTPPPEGSDFSQNQQKAIMGRMTEAGPDKRLTHLYGRVWHHFQLINPERRPSILFAPGVEESKWFAEQFTAKGVKAAHIDGESVWIDGETHRTGKAIRRQVLDASKSGEIGIICNRFVLREGIDAPWIDHGIAATVFGSLQTFLQSAGRLLRAHEPPQRVTWQDHGGNVWRFGSVNADREWFLDLSEGAAVSLRANRIRQGKESPPFRCPQCNRVWPGKGRICSPKHGGCGYEVKPKEKASRMVVTVEGELRRTEAQFFSPAATLPEARGREDLGADVLPGDEQEVERHLQPGVRHLRPRELPRLARPVLAADAAGRPRSRSAGVPRPVRSAERRPVSPGLTDEGRGLPSQTPTGVIPR